MVEEKLIYDGYVKIYDVRKEKDGKVIEYTKVHLRGASCGIVINEEGKMALVTQYRPIIGMETLEVPAGTLDKGISPKEIIIEELEEECGIAKEDIISITDKPVLTYKIIENMSDGEMHIFLIKVKTRNNKPKEEDDVDEVNFYTLEEIESLINKRIVTDPKTLISYFLYKDIEKCMPFDANNNEEVICRLDEDEYDLVYNKFVLKNSKEG